MTCGSCLTELRVSRRVYLPAFISAQKINAKIYLRHGFVCAKLENPNTILHQQASKPA